MTTTCEAQAADLRLCNCADPENCTERVPGRRCKKDFHQVRITSVGTAAYELAVALTEFRDAGGSALEVVEKVEAFINAKSRASKKAQGVER